MKITDLHQFLVTFFQAHQCKLIVNQPGLLKIQLTKEMDKALMNRPFYWHYIERMGQEGEPMQLTLMTDTKQKHENAEWIHFGSPRLQQIMNYLKKTSKYTKLFQVVDTKVNTPLYPWLVINLKITYAGKQQKEEIFSIGLNLVNGMMVEDMMAKLDRLSLQQSISDYCYPISPIIKLASGFQRIEKVFDQYIKQQDHHWAEETRITLEEEIEMIQHFYQNEPNSMQMEKEIDEIKRHYTPRISYEVFNGGIFYLTNSS